ncbi:MAG: oxygen-independent coproporphyrinogen III oxidase [Betaproteobacteria bacterium]|nr:oxygen-independent coproporphyrinogen III oxidase [Gammaproteobacteria bacterium]MDH3437264.1 oxygen-independent coproporphyrinogen III oxidase [Betaproteobacteria bacterium]
MRETPSVLIEKYDVPGPRYTSYPTVPAWNVERFSADAWRERVQGTFARAESRGGISLYVHLPYCESLCTFCGCTKRITRNHRVERPYVEAVLREWDLYRSLFCEPPKLRELHFGGGTPTFFSPESLDALARGLLEGAQIPPDREFGFEAHPNSTTPEHLEALKAHGFERLSLGVQDLDPRVQDAINRIQPLENVAAVTDAARRLGYKSINFDLVYGLPMQRMESVTGTIEAILPLAPERIAFYGYAHVPWIKGVGQRKFREEDLPSGSEKLRLYQTGRAMLEAAGYSDIGMDHFAFESDSLLIAARNGTLHRNFMGYTPVHTLLTVGLGMSAIGDSWDAFAQNEKDIPRYLERVMAGQLPVFRGHVLDSEDKLLRKHILSLMCRFETEWNDRDLEHPAFRESLERLAELEADGLVCVDSNHLQVTESGRTFVRNICMAFDARLWRASPESRLFSRVI